MEVKYQPKEVYIPRGISVNQFAYAECKNIRQSMEDGKILSTHIHPPGFFIHDNFLGDTKTILFGIFDGHGGREVMEYVKFTLPQVTFSQVN